MADKSKVGKVYPPVTWEVERVKIREMAMAIGDTNPIFLDKEAAKKEGYQDTPPVPTMGTVPLNWSGVMENFIVDLDINFVNVLHGEEHYEYIKEFYPGDVLTGSPKVSDFVEKESKSGRKMHLVTMEVLWKNQNDEEVLKARSILIERL